MAYVPAVKSRNRLDWPASLLNRFMDDVFSTPTWDISESDWLPRADVHQTDSSYVIEMDLPGIEKKDVKVTFADNVLTVSGERKSKTKTDDDNYHRIERSVGSFCRTFRLPKTVDAGKIDATAKDGVLKITVPVSKEARAKEVNVDIH